MQGVDRIPTVTNQTSVYRSLILSISSVNYFVFSGQLVCPELLVRISFINDNPASDSLWVMLNVILD